MEQTFNDLYNERKRKTEQGLFGFVLWMFIETSIGIIKEHTLRIMRGDSMKNIFIHFRSPALISFLVVVPFMILELVGRRTFNEDFPFPLFGILWLLSAVFISILMPIVRNMRAGIRIATNPVFLLSSVVFLVSLAWQWGSWAIDQMPCFLGVPNCD